MTYATQTDMIDRYGQVELAQLTDRINGTIVDATVLGRALADADAEINGYLAARYTLPLATVPAILVRLACELARYNLYDDRAPETVTQRHKDTVRVLQDLSAGKVSLGLDGTNQTTAVAGGPQYKANDRVFSADTLVDY